jgi:hypothetical protein
MEKMGPGIFDAILIAIMVLIGLHFSAMYPILIVFIFCGLGLIIAELMKMAVIGHLYKTGYYVIPTHPDDVTPMLLTEKVE